MTRLPLTYPDYELRGAAIRCARKPRPCDWYGCGATIDAGTRYAYVSTGLAFCAAHWTYPEEDA